MLKTPQGNLKRWEYRFNNKQSKMRHSHFFKKECKENGFSKCGRFVVDTNNYKQPGNIYFLSEKTKIACPTNGCKSGGEYVAKYKEYFGQLGSKGKAFYVDEAFNRLEDHLINDYHVFCENKDRNASLETIRCTDAQQTAFNMCHPQVLYRRRSYTDKNEPVLYKGLVDNHKELLEYIGEMCLCEDKTCVSRKAHGKWNKKLDHFQKY